jgi:hypothetical protein
MRIDSIKGEATAVDNMDNRAIQGTKDWLTYEIVLPVAPDSESVNYGFFLQGSGEAFMKDVRLEIVPDSLMLTGLIKPGPERDLEKYCREAGVAKRERDKLAYPKQPVNLDFEQ